MLGCTCRNICCNKCISTIGSYIYTLSLCLPFISYGGHASLLVVEVFGGWGNEAINVLSKLSKKWPPSYVDLLSKLPFTVPSASPS